MREIKPDAHLYMTKAKCSYRRKLTEGSMLAKDRDPPRGPSNGQLMSAMGENGHLLPVRGDRAADTDALQFLLAQGCRRSGQFAG